MNEDKLKKITNAIQGEIDAFGEVMDVTKFRRLQKQLEKFLTTDPVTGILNRWKIEDVVRHEMSRAKGNKSKLCLLMIDIDEFKRTNDVHGHNTGDTVLRSVAREVEYAFEGTFGRSQHFGRWGGDEFVYILHSKGEREIRKVAGKALKAVGKIVYDVGHGCMIPVSVSIGVACFKDGDTTESLVARADKAMYKVKKKGGNNLEIIS